MIPVNVYSLHTMAGVISKLPFKSHKHEISVKVLHHVLCLSKVKAEALQLLLHSQHPLSVYDQILQMQTLGTCIPKECRVHEVQDAGPGTGLN